MVYCEDGSRIVFFQAEDGIRDLVRSRGLGDVYKRQSLCSAMVASNTWVALRKCAGTTANGSFLLSGFVAVSYTHLTLPTSDLV